MPTFLPPHNAFHVYFKYSHSDILIVKSVSILLINDLSTDTLICAYEIPYFIEYNVHTNIVHT